MILTSRMIDAAEAERAGLVSRVVPADKLLDEALAAATVICSLSLPSVMMAKEAVNRAFEAPLTEGVRFERRLFHSLFGTVDQREGMGAFLKSASRLSNIAETEPDPSMLMPTKSTVGSTLPAAQEGMHQVVIVGGGAGGLELATALGKTLGRNGRAAVTLIDQARSHVWKPKLHEIAAGSMDIGLHEVSYRAQAHWHGFRFRVGRLTGIDRARRLVNVAAFVDEDGVQITPARSFGYDTLVIAVGSQSNDFGTPGVAERALKLETTADARRFHRRMVSSLIRAHAQHEPLATHQPHVAIIGAGATGVELSAELHRTTRELVAYGLDRIDPEQDLKLHLIEAAERVLPGLPERISTAAGQMLEGMGFKCTPAPRSPRCCQTACAWATVASSRRSWWFGLPA